MSARKHGIGDDDIRHAVENALIAVTAGQQPDFTLIVGPSRSAASLEVGILSTEDDDCVILAMLVRPKYIKLIQGESR